MQGRLRIFIDADQLTVDEFRTVKRHMLRAMSMANHYLPVAPVDRKHIPRHQTRIVFGQRRHGLAITRATQRELGQLLSIQTMLTELFDHETGAVTTDFVPHHMCGEEFTAGHPQGCACFFHQPTGQA